MNEKLQKYARQQIIEGLNTLPKSHQRLFKLMYSHENLYAPIEDVVNNMDEIKLDWAMTQVENSLKKEEG